jgi:hypothetical protein
MKRAKQRKVSTVESGRRRQRYRLADLLAQMPKGKIEWTPELREWDEMKPVGREFGADESS